AERDITLVYGGGRIGIMGEIARHAKDNGGRVVGIIPDFLEQTEVGNQNCDELIVVDSMHERKQLMTERSDAFVVMPGGIGSLEEFFEVLTWRTLKLHDKPIIVVDIDGCWSPLAALIDSLIADGFAGAETRQAMEVVTSIEDLMVCLEKASSSKAFDARKT
ncbi:MAG: TIGR00730 family Rossman fold protein, partial [Rhodospirillales bacterium]